MAARSGLARAREQIEAKRKGRSPTIAELEAMTNEESEKFTREHATLREPWRDDLANGPLPDRDVLRPCDASRRRATIELHHARLVKHFGQDPFDGPARPRSRRAGGVGARGRGHPVLVGRRIPVGPGDHGQVLVRARSADSATASPTS